MTKAFDFDIDEAELARLLKLAEEVAKMKWEYLQVWLNPEGVYVAFDGDSICDGDNNLILLLNKLGKAGWEYCEHINLNLDNYPFFLLKRSLP